MHDPPGFAGGVHAKLLRRNFAMEFMQDFITLASSTPRKGAADSNATRIPPSPTWMIGCLEDCRFGGLEGLGVLEG